MLLLRDRPPVFIKDGYLSLKPNRPFGVEILVGGAIRAPVLEDGTPFVDIKRGEIYQVRLINNTGMDVAAELTIDGLNVFTFNSDPDADGKVRNDHKVVVPAKESVLVKGWYRTNGKCDSFLVTKYVDSAAALWPASSNIGVITARFHACWPKDGTPPVDEATSSVNATGFGPPIDERYMQVARAFGQMRAALSIRYSK